MLAKENAAFVASLSRAAWSIMAERRRQIDVEGWTPEHDDTEHTAGELANAAAAWARTQQIVMAWPGNSPTDKRSKPRRGQLVIAGALILAEIERLDRAELGRRDAQGASSRHVTRQSGVAQETWDRALEAGKRYGAGEGK